MDKDNFNKIIIGKIGNEVYLQLWKLIKKTLKILLILGIGIFIGMMIGVSINLEDKYFIMGCS